MNGITRPTLTCHRCGESIPEIPVDIRALIALQKANPASREALLAELMSAARLSHEEAEIFLRHRILDECTKQVAHCPHCGGELKTWQAKMCLHCGRDWHDASQVHFTGNA